MGKPKLTNFAQVLRLLNDLTDGEKATLRDVLRPAPSPRGSKKKAEKKPKTPAATPLLVDADVKPETDTKSDDEGPKCGVCGHGEMYQDHFPPSPHYHKFDSGKAANATKAA